METKMLDAHRPLSTAGPRPDHSQLAPCVEQKQPHAKNICGMPFD